MPCSREPSWWRGRRRIQHGTAAYIHSHCIYAAAVHAQAKKQLGWEPKVALREGLSMMVDDFAKRLGVSVPDIPGRK